MGALSCIATSLDCTAWHVVYFVKAMIQMNSQTDTASAASRQEPVITVKQVGKKFCRSLHRSLFYGVRDICGDLVGQSASIRLRSGEFWANEGIDFELKQGECLGLIGRNGAGKTTLLKLLNGLIKPDSGHISIRGRVGALIALGAGFNPILTGRENIYINGTVLGLSKQEIDENFEKIVNFAEISEFVDTPVQNFSSGMQVRLGFAIASTLEPDLLLVDEVLAVGDTRFRFKCYERMLELKDKGASVILVSHQMADIMRITDRVIVLHKGKKVFDGSTYEGISCYEDYSMDGATLANPESDNIQLHDFAFQRAGEATDGFHTGDDITLALKLKVNQPTQQLRVIIGVQGHRGEMLMYASSAHQGQLWDFEPGEHTIMMHLPECPLMFGSYRLHVALRGPGISDVYHDCYLPKPLKVIGPAPNYLGFGINGIVSLKHSWERASQRC